MSGQKITSFLWFDKQAEEAMNFYISIFKNSRNVSIKRYPDTPVPGLPMEGLGGKILTEIFELEGQRFMALDGGPVFKFNPSVSFIINCETSEEVDVYWDKLIEGGSVLMPIQGWPFSKRYGWLNDKFGVSWQIGVVGKPKDKITPALMFVGDKFGKCEEAINFYVSAFSAKGGSQPEAGQPLAGAKNSGGKDSSIEMISRYEKGEHDVEGKVKFSSFILEGQQFRAMESSLGHKFNTTGAISFYIECKDQEEVDYYWNKLTEGGSPQAQQCGWLQDKYGFSWQIAPKILGELLSDPDKDKSDRVMQAMLKMKKIVIEDLEKASRGIN